MSEQVLMLSSMTDGNDELQPEYDISDDEQEVQDEGSEKATRSESIHSNLMKAISSLDGKKKSKIKQRSEPTLEISEFHLNKATDERGVKVHELVRTLKNTASHSDIRKQLNNFQKKNPTLKTPLHKYEADKIQRTLAYQATSKDISKWDETVKANRNAEHLSFPLNQETVRPEVTPKAARKLQVTTSLEHQVYRLLKGSKHTEKKHRELTAAEEDTLSAMSLDEARERRAELQKHRALLSYYEAKCRRQNKIKSKKYHRIQRKSKAKEESKKLTDMMEHNPEEAQELLMKIDKSRAEERMSLKHKNTGKWAKGQLRFSKYNKEAREQLQEQLQQNQELTQKIAAANRGDDDNDDDESDKNEPDDEDDKSAPNPNLSDINNPWFDPSSSSKRSSSKEKDDKSVDDDDHVAFTTLEPVIAKNKDDIVVQSGSDSEESDVEEIAMTSFKESDIDDLISKARKESNGRTTSDNELEELEEDAKNEEEDGLITENLERRQTLEKLNEQWLSDDEDASKLTSKRKPSAKRTVEKKVKNQARDKQDKKVVKPEHIDPNKVFTVQPKTLDAMIPDMMDNEEAKDDEEQRMNIQQAFADDDVVDEFHKEKEDRIERDKPKVVDLNVPGWGDWGGLGVKPSKKKKKVRAAPKAKPRKDNMLHHVIINENRDKKVAMHQVNDLPRTFKHAKQFERSIRAPIGSHWNTALTVKSLTVPKVTTKMGTIIEPINAADVFEDKTKKRKYDGRDGSKRKADIMFDESPQKKKQKNRNRRNQGKKKNTK